MRFGGECPTCASVVLAYRSLVRSQPLSWVLFVCAIDVYVSRCAHSPSLVCDWPFHSLGRVSTSASVTLAYRPLSSLLCFSPVCGSRLSLPSRPSLSPSGDTPRRSNTIPCPQRPRIHVFMLLVSIPARAHAGACTRTRTRKRHTHTPSPTDRRSAAPSSLGSSPARRLTAATRRSARPSMARTSSGPCSRSGSTRTSSPSSSTCRRTERCVFSLYPSLSLDS